MKLLLLKRVVPVLAAILLLGGGWLLGQQAAATQKSLLHVFAYTPLDSATPQDFDNFKKATGELVGKIPGLKRVWVGKLRAPLADGESKRVYGVAMEFDDAKALAAYGDDPAHTTWERVYRKVRVPGTTTLDIVGE